jgi:hypothetical protein
MDRMKVRGRVALLIPSFHEADNVTETTARLEEAVKVVSITYQTAGSLRRS